MINFGFLSHLSFCFWCVRCNIAWFKITNFSALCNQLSVKQRIYLTSGRDQLRNAVKKIRNPSYPIISKLNFTYWSIVFSSYCFLYWISKNITSDRNCYFSNEFTLMCNYVLRGNCFVNLDYINKLSLSFTCTNCVTAVAESKTTWVLPKSLGIYQHGFFHYIQYISVSCL